LRAKVRRIPLHEIARELIEIARAGLQREPVRNARGDDETIFLERLDELVKGGRCPTDAIVDRWLGDWSGEIPRLIEGSSYRIAA
jgi:glutamate--cysteine ligase